MSLPLSLSMSLSLYLFPFLCPSPYRYFCTSPPLSLSQSLLSSSPFMSLSLYLYLSQNMSVFALLCYLFIIFMVICSLLCYELFNWYYFCSWYYSYLDSLYTKTVIVLNIDNCVAQLVLFSEAPWYSSFEENIEVQVFILSVSWTMFYLLYSYSIL